MKIFFIFAGLLCSSMAGAQLLAVSAGTDLTVLNGTIFRVEDLTLIPSVNFIISNNSLSKSATINHSSPNPYISRVYQFTSNTSGFSGSVQINYTDGAELNSIPENALTLNINNGISWNDFPATTRDGTGNFVLTNGLTAVAINELTLANLLTPLPVVWLSFNVIRQNGTAFLLWTTAQEQNTRNFEIEHSQNGMNWEGIGTIPAAGNSSSNSNYSFVHSTPVTGINYYRILQSDLDGQISYSEIRTLNFTDAEEAFMITGNPVTNGVLTVLVHTDSKFALYNADGKLMWQELVNPGTKYFDVSGYAKGVYLLKSNTTTQKVVIQ